MPEWSQFEDFLREAQAAPPVERPALVAALLAARPPIPWINGDTATFIYVRRGAERVALNLDLLATDPPLLPMTRLEGTHLFYTRYAFQPDDLLDYLFAVNDPMTPLSTDPDLPARIANHWKPDPLNPQGIRHAHADVSVLRMPKARPFPEWHKMTNVNRGNTVEHTLTSSYIGERKVWVHLPPNYEAGGLLYPLLILQDGQWMKGPLQVPPMVDVLLKHGRVGPMVVAMVQSGPQPVRLREYVTSGAYPRFVTEELIPYLNAQYRLDGKRVAIGGASAGAVAAASTALGHPEAFTALAMISPPLGSGPAQAHLRPLLAQFNDAPLLPLRVFHAVGRYEASARFLEPNRKLAALLRERADIQLKSVEIGSAHGLSAFRSILPEALAWVFPGVNSG